jgi:preprotein translocase subunit SecG
MAEQMEKLWIGTSIALTILNEYREKKVMLSDTKKPLFLELFNNCLKQNGNTSDGY